MLKEEEEKDNNNEELNKTSQFEFSTEDIDGNWATFPELEKCLAWRICWHGQLLCLFAQTTHVCFKKELASGCCEEEKQQPFFVHDTHAVLRPKIEVTLVHQNKLAKEDGYKHLASRMFPFSQKQEDRGLLILPFVGLLKNSLESILVRVTLKGVRITDQAQALNDDNTTE